MMEKKIFIKLTLEEQKKRRNSSYFYSDGVFVKKGNRNRHRISVGRGINRKSMRAISHAMDNLDNF